MSRFARKPARFAPQPTVLVICEDSKSAKNYLQDAAHHLRAHLQIEITHCGKTDPVNIVKEALARQKDFDIVYCVIDRDTHEKFAQARQVAQQSKKVKLIVSYPCYEFWLLLHFGYRRKPYLGNSKKSAAELVQKDLLEALPEYAKGDAMNLFVQLKDDWPKASKHAEKILQDVVNTGEHNPSTTLHLLLEHFVVLGAPQALANKKIDQA